jgi:hypothetical protein
MKYMPARKFLRCRVWAISRRHRYSWRISLIPNGSVLDHHLFTTNYASMITHGGHFFLGGIWIAFIHISGSRAVPHEVPQTGDERPSSHVHVANDVERDAVECNDNRKESKISRQLEKIFGTSWKLDCIRLEGAGKRTCDQINVKNIHTFVLPRWCILSSTGCRTMEFDSREDIFGFGIDQTGQEDRVLDVINISLQSDIRFNSTNLACKKNDNADSVGNNTFCGKSQHHDVRDPQEEE